MAAGRANGLRTPVFRRPQTVCASSGSWCVPPGLRGVRHLRSAGPMDGGHGRTLAHPPVAIAPLFGMAALSVPGRPLRSVAGDLCQSKGRRFGERHLIHRGHQVLRDFGFDFLFSLLFSHCFSFHDEMKCTSGGICLELLTCWISPLRGVPTSGLSFRRAPVFRSCGWACGCGQRFAT